MNMHFRCPVCGQPLQETAAAYRCEHGHSFDRAADGYVNLLQRQKHRLRGDDAEMVRARRDFLDAGYYRPLLDALTEAAAAHAVTQIADIGCGEGWYSCGLLRKLPDACLCGFDISPAALRYAGKRAKAEQLTDRTGWAVASVNRIPLADDSCDCIVNLFAPCEAGEFTRILRSDGVLLRVIPLEKHLWELKTAVYDVPYENRPVREAPAGFVLADTVTVSGSITVSGEDLQNLFAMTPYARKTAPEDAARLQRIDALTVRTEFGVLICHKLPDKT